MIYPIMTIFFDPDFITADDQHYFNEGRFYQLSRKLGAHPHPQGIHFAVWAPNARFVSVMGDFNGWDPHSCPLRAVGNSGIWAGVHPDARLYQTYKFHICSHHLGYQVDKADPVAFYAEQPPKTASVIWQSNHHWEDGEWMRTRKDRQALSRPMSIYEVHLGSWKRKVEEGGRPLSYRELAVELGHYVRDQGFSHIELMPVMEYPFGGSWGYQSTGYYAPTSRYGTPDDFKYFVDYLHQLGIGIILDWVPSHFPNDQHGLDYFDGTHLYEHSDPRQGFHPDWNSCIFNYGRNEVRSFLISSALHWLGEYHIDGLRVDAVASMLYLDYSRKSGEWIPNIHGGRDNLEAVSFLRELNEACYLAHPDIHMIAEESTSWPMVSRPASMGGLGFGMKWDMGWMHDTLEYFAHDPIHRKFRHHEITFRAIYAFTENFVLSISHDECTHGKKSLLHKMPGDDWQRTANLRCLLAYMFASPGKKLLFMGCEFAQHDEWSHDKSLDWHLLNFAPHQQVQLLVRDLNFLYRNHAALQVDFDPNGFTWVDMNDREQSIISFLRFAPDRRSAILCLFNFTPCPRHDYRIGVPFAGEWREILNSDAAHYGGANIGNGGAIHSGHIPNHGHAHSLNLTIPPLGGVFLEWKA